MDLERKTVIASGPLKVILGTWNEEAEELLIGKYKENGWQPVKDWWHDSTVHIGKNGAPNLMWVLMERERGKYETY